jgi:hypothetical protein
LVAGRRFWKSIAETRAETQIRSANKSRSNMPLISHFADVLPGGLSMAGDYIPMRTDLDEDPAVVGIAAILKVDRLQVIGLLWKLWSTASKQTASGYLPHYTPEIIDGLVSQTGFADACISVGWLHRRAKGLEIPSFQRWLSQSAKTRMLRNERQARWRATRDDVDDSASTKASTRGDKRRGDNSFPDKPEEKKKDEPGKTGNAREPCALFDALAEVTGSDPKICAKKINQTKDALLGADPPYTAQNVRALPAVMQAWGFTYAITLRVVENYIARVRQPLPASNATNGAAPKKPPNFETAESLKEKYGD